MTDILLEEQHREDELKKAEEVLMKRTNKSIPIVIDHSVIDYKIVNVDSGEGTIDVKLKILGLVLPEKFFNKFVIARMYKMGHKLVTEILKKENVDVDAIVDDLTFSIGEFVLESGFIRFTTYDMGSAKKNFMRSPQKITEQFLKEMTEELENQIMFRNPEMVEHCKQECERILNVLHAHDEGVITDESGQKHPYKMREVREPHINMYHDSTLSAMPPITMVLSKINLNTEAEPKDINAHFTDVLHRYNINDVYVFTY